MKIRTILEFYLKIWDIDDNLLERYDRYICHKIY